MGSPGAFRTDARYKGDTPKFTEMIPDYAVDLIVTGPLFVILLLKCSIAHVPAAT
jgi:hypothetical protein